MVKVYDFGVTLIICVCVRHARGFSLLGGPVHNFGTLFDRAVSVIPSKTQLSFPHPKRQDSIVNKAMEVGQVPGESLFQPKNDNPMAMRVINPGLFSTTIKGRSLNLCGFLYLGSVFLWGFIVYPVLVPFYLFSLVFDPKCRRLVDYVMAFWQRMACLCLTYKPKVEGLENLPPHGEPVIYMPNHTSFMDIFTLSGFLPRRFKYISKVEILRIPLIGWAMQMSGYIAIARASMASQMAMFKDTLSSIKAGNSMLIFPEGTRTKDGKMISLKKGPFTIARKTKVRIVPVSIGNLFQYNPPSSWLPLGKPNGAVLRIHPPIDTKGKNEAELMDEVRKAIDSGLPEWQQSE
mmetsp:Transcript_13028/g.19226  ORF Transcript_13028/g.19226 Transcript_13028/m.19226 type:complete len:348 (-) Transcript_13028:241-1284(-)|eukprot:CAMPEP_0113944184 /NCGR_PEP_ID=MMETSP1339-20121228/30986_1 /TAXON_ID=94617 /ORGANISM="Fibrocapsa japonica" /LENGTH=347 /DNA_ID=CAMNT_0000949275 /DNA_START=97 /DNA_END=1140 /DNA_ORIENTATION=- /assembly_acc=CAM_ASM_000762